MITQASSHRQKRWWTRTQRKGREVTHSRDSCQSKNPTEVWKVWIKIHIAMEKNIQIFYFRGGKITVIFKVWQRKARRRKGQSERNWSVLQYRHTLHFYHSEGDRQRLVWQGWSSLVCSGALTATWRGWMDWPAIPTKTHAVGENDTFICLIISFSHDQVL